MSLQPLEVAMDKDLTPVRTLLASELNILKAPVCVDFRDFQAVQETVLHYLEMCRDSGTLPRITALAHSLGKSKSSMQEWMRKHPDMPASQFLYQVSECVADCLAEAGLHNKVNPVLSIFCLKNYHGWKDSVTIEAPVIDNGSAPSEDQIKLIRERYGVVDDE